jgi:hypothetical protein
VTGDHASDLAPTGLEADVLAHLWSVRQAAADRALLTEGMQAAWEASDDATARGLAARLQSIPEIRAIDALGAGFQLARYLVAARWLDVLACREEGTSWAKIGATLGVSGAEARAEYERAIGDRERATDGLHDAGRARAVLSDDETGQPC